MRASFPSTLTQAVYYKQEKFVHKEGIPNEEYEKEVKIWGSDRILEKGDSKMLNGLVLTNDVEEVRDVLDWINITPVYVWRKNKESFSQDKRVARFNAFSGRVGFYLFRYPVDQCPSLGYKWEK